MSRQRLRLVGFWARPVYRDQEIVQPIALQYLISSQLVTAFILIWCCGCDC